MHMDQHDREKRKSKSEESNAYLKKVWHANATCQEWRNNDQAIDKKKRTTLFSGKKKNSPQNTISIVLFFFFYGKGRL